MNVILNAIAHCDTLLCIQVRLASGILKGGLHCLALFKEKDEEKEMYSHYSSVFAVMEHRNLMDMFSLCMPQLFECMLANLQLLQIFSTLLYTPKVKFQLLNKFISLRIVFCRPCL